MKNSLVKKLPVIGRALDSESVHQLRKGTKQLRAHLDLVRQLNGQQADIESLGQSVKKFARLLAGQRDADVISALLAELRTQTSDQEIPALIQELLNALESTQPPPINTRSLRKLAREIDQGCSNLFSYKFEEAKVNSLLESQLKNLCDEGQQLLFSDTINWKELHNWRKHVKKLTYQYKLKKSHTRTETSIIENLELLGDHLGKVNDYTILGKFATQEQSRNTRAQILLAFTTFHDLLKNHKHALISLCQQHLSALESLAAQQTTSDNRAET